LTKYFTRDSLLLFFCLFLSLTLYFSSKSTVVLSVKSELADIISLLRYPSDWYTGILSTRKENKILSEQLIQQKLLNTELVKYAKENQELRSMLRFYKEQPWSLIVGKIINDNSTYLRRSLIINLGEKDSVAINSPVLDTNGLIGKIIHVGDRASGIQLINDKNFTVSVRVGKDLVLGEFVPAHDKYGTVSGIYKTADINTGDIVYTSGISTIYPEGIQVAKVISTNRDTDKAFQEIVVEILADLKNYNFIFVLS